MFVRPKELIFCTSENFAICPKVGVVTKKSQVKIPIESYHVHRVVHFLGMIKEFTWPGVPGHGGQLKLTSRLTLTGCILDRVGAHTCKFQYCFYSTVPFKKMCLSKEGNDEQF